MSTRFSGNLALSILGKLIAFSGSFPKREKETRTYKSEKRNYKRRVGVK
jgi:hypothetical protein